MSQKFLSVSQNFLSLCPKIPFLSQHFLSTYPKFSCLYPRIPSPCLSQSVIPSFWTDCYSWPPFLPFPVIIPFFYRLRIINYADFGAGPGRSPWNNPGVGWGSKFPKKQESRDLSLEQQPGMGSRSQILGSGSAGSLLLLLLLFLG